MDKTNRNLGRHNLCILNMNWNYYYVWIFFCALFKFAVSLSKYYIEIYYLCTTFDVEWGAKRCYLFEN